MDVVDLDETAAEASENHPVRHWIHRYANVSTLIAGGPANGGVAFCTDPLAIVPDTWSLRGWPRENMEARQQPRHPENHYFAV